MRYLPYTNSTFTFQGIRDPCFTCHVLLCHASFGSVSTVIWRGFDWVECRERIWTNLMKHGIFSIWNPVKSVINDSIPGNSASLWPFWDGEFTHVTFCKGCGCWWPPTIGCFHQGLSLIEFSVFIKFFLHDFSYHAALLIYWNQKMNKSLSVHRLEADLGIRSE